LTSEQYTHGHHGSVVASHAGRTAADSAAYLLPLLEPGMRLLDVGCGPGSISLDLAGMVSHVVGIDGADAAIERANADARRRGVANAEFHVADAYELPFEDAAFDVVHAHQVLQHLADPVRALREARRVVKPGGIVAARDADYGTMVHDPHEPRLDRWLELYQQVARRDGGEPDAGRRLAGWFTAAGLSDLGVTTSTWTYSTMPEIEAWHDLWISRLTEARFGRRAMELGLADRVELDDLADGWRAWASSDRPFFAFLHGEVVGRR
jgi:ubiquinone/menaquinone biosynthesis C-methylase UbiE